MNINSLKELLTERIHKGLPGWDAHVKMSTHVHQHARLKPPQHTRKAAVMMLLYPKDNQLWMPLIERPVYDGVHSGQMALPGGKVEPEDTDLMHTAIRETFEEIGVKVKPEKMIGRLSDLYIPPSNMMVSPFVGLLEDPPSYIADPLEVASIIDISVQSLRVPENYLLKKIKVYNGNVLNAPSFILEGKTIWGATAMMLSELVILMEDLD